MVRHILAGAILALAASSSSAALLGRAPLTPGGPDYQAYYDTVLHITWVADANLAKSSGYDPDGLLTWAEAGYWVSSLNSANAGQGYLGQQVWRLPVVVDMNTPGCNFGYSGTDCGWNVDAEAGELANLFYGTLGNQGSYSTTGASTGCLSYPPCLTNRAPFGDLQAYFYWYGTLDATDPTDAWNFAFHTGLQNNQGIDDQMYVLAVVDGDPLAAAVPIPAALWLFSGAVGALGVVMRSAKSAA